MFYNSNNYVKRETDHQTIYIADSIRDAEEIVGLMNLIKFVCPSYSPETEYEKRYKDYEVNDES